MALVLVVDDSQYARRVHGRVLQSGGHEVVEAASGAEAIEAFALRSPDLVVLDLTMADMGGIEVLAKLKELNADARVVVVSADVQRSTGDLVADAGAVAFLGKPADPALLLDAVTKGLAAR
jgi:two-component system, chemotaxis family, chemotaxis protein CheY